jgi:hypothetical protein
LRDQILHPSIAGRFQRAVIEFGLHAAHSRLHCLHHHLCILHLCAGCSHSTPGCRHLRLCRLDRRLCAFRAGTIIVEVLFGHRILCRKRFGAHQPLLRRLLLALALENHSLGCQFFALPRRHLRLGGDDRIFRLPKLCLGLQKLGIQNVGLNPGEHLAFLHEIAFTHQNLRQTPRHSGCEIDLGGLNASVARYDPWSKIALQAMPPEKDSRHG